MVYPVRGCWLDPKLSFSECVGVKVGGLEGEVAVGRLCETTDERGGESEEESLRCQGRMDAERPLALVGPHGPLGHLAQGGPGDPSEPPWDPSEPRRKCPVFRSAQEMRAMCVPPARGWAQWDGRSQHPGMEL